MSEKPVLRLRIDDFISVNHYTKIRAFIKYVQGKPKAMATKYTTQETKKAQKKIAEYVKKEVEKQGWSFSESKFQHYYMDFTFHFPRVDMDDQNYLKVPLDAMNGIVYIDDSVLLTRTQRIYYNSLDPHIDIELYPVDYIGIFDNQEQLNSFESNCQSCKRYKNNCSILRKAKEGRIQNEIDGELNCSKYNPLKNT